VARSARLEGDGTGEHPSGQDHDLLSRTR
jgi:hypothetical protein